MNPRTFGIRGFLAAALVLGVSAGPGIFPAVADAPATACQDRAGAPDAKALREAITGLPHARATAALVRVGGDEGSWHGSSGVRDLDSGRPADPDARFRAGSVTKVFTAAVVLQLAAEGKVGLDRPVRSYLPDLVPAAYGRVTVRQLLNHTHGIPSADVPGGTVEEWYENRFAVHDPRAMVRSATAKTKEFEPGTEQHYLNIGYTVAGLLVERVTGERYADAVGRRVLKPLGLRGTYFPGTDPRIRGPHNRGYQTMTLDDGVEGLLDVTVWGVTDAWAAGDLISTTADLERFTKALFQGRIVRGPLLEEMFTLPGERVRDHVSGDPAVYSAGLSVSKQGGREIWGKTGARWGYSTGIGATRDLCRTLVYNVNSTDAKGQGTNSVAAAVIGAVFSRPGH
ncbi:serine hydrolase domain-containing protein [Streptomyces sp. SCSIO 30461]|uniref:serine hydrolase domain-containing protein n=1 Tax=Streptomyces sp. SCSIO 30461 TaxID=3118085 RepID=UPI0030CBA8B4